MPLLLNNTIVEDDAWSYYDDDTVLPADLDHVIVSVERWQQQRAQNAPLPAGVRLSPADTAGDIGPFVESLSLICIEFPVYTDGRGYSHARILRKRFGYTGQLRAVGDIRPDQMLFMSRSGINAFEGEQVPGSSTLAPYMTRFEHNYQPSYPLPNAQFTSN